jgi:hypothetical protein
MPAKHIEILLRALLVASSESAIDQEETLGAANSLLLELGLPEAVPVFEDYERPTRWETHEAIRESIARLHKEFPKAFL